MTTDIFGSAFLIYQLNLWIEQFWICHLWICGGCKEGERGGGGWGEGVGRVQAFLIQSEPGHRSVRVMLGTMSISEFLSDLAILILVVVDKSISPQFECYLTCTFFKCVIYFKIHFYSVQNLMTLK